MAKLYLIKGRIFYEDGDKLSLLNGAILDTETSGTGSQNLSCGFISSNSATYEPTLSPGSVNLQCGFISSNSATYEPTVDLSGGTQTISDTDFISSGSATYEPTLAPGAVNIPCGFISSNSATYEPTISAGVSYISLGFISSGSATYEPTVSPGSVDLSCDFISSGSALYEPVVYYTQYLSCGFISSGSALYEPSVTNAAAQNLALNFIQSRSSLYEPRLYANLCVDRWTKVTDRTTAWSTLSVNGFIYLIDETSGYYLIDETTGGRLIDELGSSSTWSTETDNTTAWTSQTCTPAATYSSSRLQCNFISSGYTMYEPSAESVVPAGIGIIDPFDSSGITDPSTGFYITES